MSADIFSHNRSIVVVDENIWDTAHYSDSWRLKHDALSKKKLFDLANNLGEQKDAVLL